jgi:hypothetical protein
MKPPFPCLRNRLYRNAGGSNYWFGGALMFASPAITAIVIVIFTVLGFGGGFAVSDWRSGKEVQRLSSENAVLRAANDKCATDVVAVRAGVKDVTDALDAKKRAADAAMKDAQYWASKHSTLADEVNSLPVRPDETPCPSGGAGAERLCSSLHSVMMRRSRSCDAGAIFRCSRSHMSTGAFQASRI